MSSQLRWYTHDMETRLGDRHMSFWLLLNSRKYESML